MRSLFLLAFYYSNFFAFELSCHLLVSRDNAILTGVYTLQKATRFRELRNQATVTESK